jgi:LuxR family maltose regulon positive regulatory protein
VRLVEQRAEALLIGSEMTTLQRRIVLLPEALVQARPRLALAYAGVLLTAGDVAAVEPLLQAAEQSSSMGGGSPMEELGPRPTDGTDVGWLDDVPAVAGTLRSIVARAQNNLPRAIALAHAVLDHTPSRFLFLRSAATWNLGMAFWSSGDLTAAGDTFATSWAANQAPDHAYGLLVAASSLGQIRIAQGRLREAAQLYRQSLNQSSSAGVRVPSVGMIYVGLGDILRE